MEKIGSSTRVVGVEYNLTDVLIRKKQDKYVASSKKARIVSERHPFALLELLTEVCFGISF